MIPVNSDRPIWQLTVGELLELINNQSKGARNVEPVEKKEYVHGLEGIAKLFGCSIRNAQNIKNSGKIDAAISQIDRTIVVDAKLALELLKKSKGK